VLEAIKEGMWDFEPAPIHSRDFDETDALPGSDEKLAVMARRLERGLPLWHPHDRRDREGLFEKR
jgi:hypothetical protein